MVDVMRAWKMMGKARRLHGGLEAVRHEGGAVRD